MIDPVKKKLDIIFLSMMIGIIFLILLTVYFFMDYRLTQSVRDHLVEAIHTEFMPLYRNNDFEVLSKIVEDELFQVLDKSGRVVLSVRSSVPFNPTLNESLFADAGRGHQVFETITHNKKTYLVSYYPLDKKFVGRAVHPLEPKEVFRKNFMILVLIAFPFMVLLAYVSSRYMVSQSLKPISAAMKYQKTFSSNVSHELNSPLTSIKGSLEVALRKDRPTEEYRGIIKSALSQIDNIIVLLNNLGLIATSKFKPLDLYREKVNMSEIIDDVVDKYEPNVYAKSVALNLSTHTDESCKTAVSMECDATLMRRAIENLLDNAVKYTPPGGAIEIICRNDGSHFTFTIANTCSDISKDDLKNLCEPFYRGKNVRENNVEGRGLGLHVVQYIAYSHGGSLTPNLQNGTFTITMKIPNTLHGKSLRMETPSATK